MIVKFGPFLSTAEASFWTKLAEKKLNDLKLSEEPIEITGSYSVNSAVNVLAGVAKPPARLRVDADSFDVDGSNNDGDGGSSDGQTGNHMILRNESIQCGGKMTLLNTAESFKRLDKQALLNECGKKIKEWLLCEGNEHDKLELLHSFECISFLDLKKHSTVYWFAFPAIVPKSPLTFIPGFKNSVGAQPLRALLGRKQCTLLATSVTKMRLDQENYCCPPYFIAVNLLHHSNEEKSRIRCLPLSVQNFKALTETEKAVSVFCFVDPCALPENPGWPMRNLAAYLGIKLKLKSANILAFRPAVMRRLSLEMIEEFCERCSRLENNDNFDAEDDFVSVNEERSDDNSLLMSVSLDVDWNNSNSVGWEANARGKMGPRIQNLKSVMDENVLAQQSVDLNLKLMRWRLLPELDVEMLSRTKCLLLGAGTLGCGVARTLMAWGVRNITFLDNGRVSYSNPVRQSLFELKDCGNASGGAFKAIAASEALGRIFPGVVSRGIVATIPMPGHPIGKSEISSVQKEVKQLDSLIEEHDVIFLLTDTRESRWLPTVIASAKDKLLINAALGLDSWLVMRHGSSPDDDNNSRLGCYFCNDIVAPDNSMRERTLDQQCTVTRPGLAHIAAAMAVELMVGVVHDEKKHRASAGPTNSNLGVIPHQIRGFLSAYTMMTPTTPAFDCCTACSSKVVNTYRNDQFDFVKRVSHEVSYLEDLSGLRHLRDQAEDVDVDWGDDDEDSENDF